MYDEECVMYLWSLQFIDKKQRHNHLTSLGSVARFPPLTSSSSSITPNKVGEAASPLGDNYSQFQSCKLSSFAEKLQTLNSTL